jgi:hypothetical protein
MHLSPATLTQRLELQNPLLIEHLHDVQKARLADDEARRAKLELKAFAIQIASLVSFMLLGLITAWTRSMAPNEQIRFVAVTFFSAGFWSLFWAVWNAQLVLRVTDHHELKEDDIFPEDVLQDADARQTNIMGEHENARRRSIYLRWSIACMAKVLLCNKAVNDLKAEKLHHAQSAFLLFLGVLAVFGLILLSVTLGLSWNA